MSFETEPVQDSPPVTSHAALQWHDRATDPSVSPGTAWVHAQRVDASGPLINVEIRLHRESQTLLLFDAGSITTVLALDELREDVYHAVKHALPDDGGESA